jgi:hypothetical protein
MYLRREHGAQERKRRSGVKAIVGSTFETNEPMLAELLQQVGSGAVQLPDFQRGWVWDNEHIRSLVASVSLSHPIGAIMLLETGGNSVRFKPRLVEGVKLSHAPMPAKLILDGQQRITALYLALCGDGPVPTTTDKDEPIERFYYLDMGRCLDPDVDRMDAVIAVPADRVIRADFARVIALDVRTREGEYASGLFPLAITFDPVAALNWVAGYQEHCGYDKEKIQFVNRFQSEVWQRFQQYKIPVIELLQGTEKEAVCQVFEKVNTGGVTLSVFELLTATFAADDFSLRDDWEARRTKLADDASLKNSRDLILKMDETAFLTAVTLLCSHRRHEEEGSAVSCKRRDVLRLALDEYRAYADQIQRGLVAAGKFLVQEKVFSPRELPYTTQLIPLSAICAELGPSLGNQPVREKLARWYWCGVFGELYGSATETRYALDLPQVVGWTRGGEEPQTVRDCSFAPTRLLTLQTRNSAAYQGLMAQLMQLGSRDFLSGEAIEFTNYFDDAVDIHHIFPKAWSEKMGLPRLLWNSVVNKAPLTARTNRYLGGYAPSHYLAKLETKKLSVDLVDELLETHGINPQTLRGDDFAAFAQDRASALLDLIEGATGRLITGRDTQEVVTAFGGPLTAESLRGHVRIPSANNVPVLVEPSSSEHGQRNPAQTPHPELLEVIRIFDAQAPAELRTVGTSGYYRQVRVPGWHRHVHYEFYQLRSAFCVTLDLEGEEARPLGHMLRSFAGQSVAGGLGKLDWDERWSAGRGRLIARFSYPVDASAAAAAMVDLIALTRPKVDAALREATQQKG